MKCSHVFHYDCVIDRLTNRWNTHEVNLKFTQCPICNQNISAFFKKWEDTQLMQEISALRQHLRFLVQTQTQTENIVLSFPNDSDLFLEEGLRVLNFYECNSCKSIYFGGTRVCGEAGVTSNISSELICPSCRNQCDKHGEEQMIFKCRFCCTIASYFCFGHSHFCESCHPNAFALLQGSKQNYLKQTVPQCSGKDNCPLGIDHPPNGEEFAIGCAICKNEQTIETEQVQKIEEESRKKELVASVTNQYVGKNSDSANKEAAFVIQIHPPDVIVEHKKLKKGRRKRKKR